MVFFRDSIEREKKTIRLMIGVYCFDHHSGAGGELCGDCEELARYAEVRLDKCPFGAGKGPCSKCEVHCYKPEMQERVVEVMRYSGPKMVRRHPLLAMGHLFRKFKKFKRKRS